MKFILVSYYTPGGIYEESALKLGAAAMSIGVDFRAYSVPDMGGWCANTDYKARFVLDRMLEFPDRNVAYTDADSLILRYPELFDEPEADFLIRRQDFPWRKGEFLGGTFLVRNGVAARNTVELWVDKVNDGSSRREDPTSWEQYRFGQAILESGASWKQLPHGYVYYDHTEQIEGRLEEPYFAHKQFSRITCRKEIGI